MDQTLADFDQAQWEVLCSTAASEATRQCGSVDVMYVKFFSEAVDQHVAKLPEEHRTRAIEVATEWDYASPQEREQTRRELAAEGQCSHGLHPDHCPLGCGDLPRDGFDEMDAP